MCIGYFLTATPYVAFGHVLLRAKNSIDIKKVRQKQTRTDSFKEQLTGQIATLTLTIATAELFVYELFGMTVSTRQNLGIMLYFFIQNIILRYCLRRHYENRLI